MVIVRSLMADGEMVHPNSSAPISGMVQHLVSQSKSVEMSVMGIPMQLTGDNWVLSICKFGVTMSTNRGSALMLWISVPVVSWKFCKVSRSRLLRKLGNISMSHVSA